MFETQRDKKMNDALFDEFPAFLCLDFSERFLSNFQASRGRKILQ